MTAHARTLEFGESSFFAVSLKVFEAQKSIIYHFQGTDSATSIPKIGNYIVSNYL